jgi:uncharacterized protein (DUF433 family)
MKLERIVSDPGICLGRPTVRGTRITVDFILRLIGEGLTAEAIVRDYPELSLDDIKQAARYAAWLTSERLAGVG